MEKNVFCQKFEQKNFHFLLLIFVNNATNMCSVYMCIVDRETARVTNFFRLFFAVLNFLLTFVAMKIVYDKLSN